MKYIAGHISLVFMVVAFCISCGVEPVPEVAEPGRDGEILIRFASSAPDEILMKAEAGEQVTGDDRIENAIVFIFDGNGNCLAKQWSYIEDSRTMYMYIPSGDVRLFAVCNLLDPETVMNRVDSLEDLEKESVTVTDFTGAYKGKYVMAGDAEVNKDHLGTASVVIPVERIAAQFNLTVKFAPVVGSHDFQISEVSVHNVPKGSWIVPKEASVRDALSGDTPRAFVLSRTGSKDDWTYLDNESGMGGRYFSKGVLSMEGTDIREGLTSSFSMFENRRGALSTAETDYAVNWPDISNRDEEDRKVYAQLWKKELADAAATGKTHQETAGIEYATYLEIRGVYQAGANTYEAGYYVYLGADNFSSFDAERNHKYDMTVTIKAIDDADTRIDEENISSIRVYYDESSPLDAHCNSVKTLLYSPSGWEAWVKEPDSTPWLELSTSSDYRPLFLGEAGESSKAGFRISGESGMHYIYIHTDEYVPDLGSPEANNRAPSRHGSVCYRRAGDTEQHEFIVSQYPAQMVVLHIKYDIHTMEEVRDTFYVERILEKKHLKYGFDFYWCLRMDDMISSGQWDGLSNTRNLYDVALNGDILGIQPAYPEDPDYPAEGENRIPNNVALRYIVDKNRDRNGNGYIDSDEIMWFMPAINEMEALYEAKSDLLVTFEGADDYFFSSTPSSSDPNGITNGYAYYIKMGSGKTGLASRTSEYNVIACRRANAWKGPSEAGGSVSVGKDDNWNEEEVIMPK